MMQISDSTTSSEEEISSSLSSTRPASRASTRSRHSQHQGVSFTSLPVDSSGMASPLHRANSGSQFQYIAQLPNQDYSFQHRQSIDHNMLDANSFPSVNISTLGEPMLTPRPEYLHLPGPILDGSLPLHASSLPNESLWGSTPNQSMNGFPFPETFNVSPLESCSIDRQYAPQLNASRKTTIVLEDIEESTLSKVMNILIQEKAKVRMETTPSDRPSDSR